MTLDELTEFIKKNISYDGHQTQAKIVCPNCRCTVRDEEFDYYLDHRESFVSNISNFLGLKSSKMRRIVDDVVSGLWSTGNTEVDSDVLARDILKEIE